MLSSSINCPAFFSLFFFNDTSTTEIYTLSLHDALPISVVGHRRPPHRARELIDGPVLVEVRAAVRTVAHVLLDLDRKSTRLNSSHSQISYAVFCLKKKKKKQI